MDDRPTKLWQAIERWSHLHPIVLMYVASKAVYTRGPIDWAANGDRTQLGQHCASFRTANEAWAALPVGDRRDYVKAAKLPHALAAQSWDDVALAFAKSVEEDRRALVEPEPIEAVMKVPNSLLRWADGQQLAWPRPWASEVRALLAEEQPLSVSSTVALLCRLEAVAHEAIAAGRGDLLAGFDTLTAELLGLVFEFTSEHGRISIGRSGTWSYSEIDEILATEDPRSAVKAAIAAKSVVSQVFKTFRVTTISKDEESTCTMCGGPPGPVMMLFESGSEVCRQCWTKATSPMPEGLRPRQKPEKSRSTTSLDLIPSQEGTSR